nr:hypothetical protein [Tanacetum cinerariifolium]
KQSNDVTRLQALVEKKRVVVTEATIRDVLHLDDAEGVDCLPNEEIFATLARMGYENSSTKLTFYKAFFSKEQSNDDNTAKEPVTVVDDVQSPPPQQQSLPLAQPQVADFPMSLLQEALDACVALARRVKHLEHDKRIESSDDTIMEDVSNQGRMINESDKDEGAELMNEKEEKETKEVRVNPDNAQVEGRQADIYHIDMDHASKVLSMQEDEPEIQEAVEVVTTAKLITEVVAAVSKTVSAAAVVQADVPAAPVNAAAVV